MPKHILDDEPDRVRHLRRFADDPTGAAGTWTRLSRREAIEVVTYIDQLRATIPEPEYYEVYSYNRSTVYRVRAGAVEARRADTEVWGVASHIPIEDTHIVADLMSQEDT